MVQVAGSQESHSEPKQQRADGVASTFDESHLDDENTTTKKRQGQPKAVYPMVSTAQQDILLSVPSKKAQLAMMQSPLASYIQRANLGTSASYH